MNKLAVIIPFYKRTELTKLCFKHILKQSRKFGFSVFVCGDDNSIVPKEFNIVVCDNNPLGKKNNTLLNATKDYDGVLIVGSDDFLSDSIFELYQTIDLNEEIYYGFDNCHIYSVWDGKLGTDLVYSINGNTIGVARLWTKSTLKKMNYKLWTDSKNSGLDGDSKLKMVKKGIKEVKLSYDSHFIVDVKHENNITHPNLINTCTSFNDVNMIVAELGAIGNDILDLKVGCVKQIPRAKVSIESRRQDKLNRRKNK